MIEYFTKLLNAYGGFNDDTENNSHHENITKYLTDLIDAYGGFKLTEKRTLYRIDSYNEALNDYIECNFSK